MLMRRGLVWQVVYCAGYIVPPCKGLPDTQAVAAIRGSVIAPNDLPLEYFRSLIDDCPEYPVGVVFRPQNGNQRNEVRDLIRELAFGDQVAREHVSRTLACRLGLVTDNRSPTGLLMVLVVTAASASRVILWKFPADEIIQAAVSNAGISIRILQDAFLKESRYFKAVAYEDTDGRRTFWTGRAEDRQAKSNIAGLSDYWIRGFLCSDPEITDAQGTRHLAKMLRALLSQTEPVEDQETLVNVAFAVKAKHGEIHTLRGFAQAFLPNRLREEFERLAENTSLLDIPFRLDREVLDRELKLKAITLDGQFTVRGPLDTFDARVAMRHVPDRDEVEVTLAGTITDRRVHVR